jgi:hypothetical protein
MIEPTYSANHFKPQELGTILWALATADVLPEYVDELDNTLLLLSPGTTTSRVVVVAEWDPVTTCFAVVTDNTFYNNLRNLRCTSH